MISLIMSVFLYLLICFKSGVRANLGYHPLSSRKIHIVCCQSYSMSVSLKNILFVVCIMTTFISVASATNTTIFNGDLELGRVGLFYASTAGSYFINSTIFHDGSYSITHKVKENFEYKDTAFYTQNGNILTFYYYIHSPSISSSCKYDLSVQGGSCYIENQASVDTSKYQQWVEYSKNIDDTSCINKTGKMVIRFNNYCPSLISFDGFTYAPATPPEPPVCYYTVSQNIGIAPAHINIADTSTNEPTTVLFNITNSSGQQYDYFTGTAGVSKDVSFTTSGSYTLNQIAYNSVGRCERTSNNIINIMSNQTMPSVNVTMIPIIVNVTILPTALPTLLPQINTTYIKGNITAIMPFSDPILSLFEDTLNSFNNAAMFLVVLALTPLYTITTYGNFALSQVVDFEYSINSVIVFYVFVMEKIIDVFPWKVQMLLTAILSVDIIKQIIDIVPTRRIK